jgi:hypothetical protein
MQGCWLALRALGVTVLMTLAAVGSASADSCHCPCVVAADVLAAAPKTQRRRRGRAAARSRRFRKRGSPPTSLGADDPFFAVAGASAALPALGLR